MTQQSLLSAACILEVEDLAHEDVQVKEWGGVVRIRQLDAEGLSNLTAEMEKPENAKQGIFIMLIATATDLEGNPLFKGEDLEKLKRKNPRVMNRLQRVAIRLNQIGEESEAELKKD